MKVNGNHTGKTFCAKNWFWPSWPILIITKSFFPPAAETATLIIVGKGGFNNKNAETATLITKTQKGVFITRGVGYLLYLMEKKSMNTNPRKPAQSGARRANWRKARKTKRGARKARNILHVCDTSGARCAQGKTLGAQRKTVNIAKPPAQGARKARAR